MIYVLKKELENRSAAISARRLEILSRHVLPGKMRKWKCFAPREIDRRAARLHAPSRGLEREIISREHGRVSGIPATRCFTNVSPSKPPRQWFSCWECSLCKLVAREQTFSWNSEQPSWQLRFLIWYDNDCVLDGGGGEGGRLLDGCCCRTQIRVRHWETRCENWEVNRGCFYE